MAIGGDRWAAYGNGIDSRRDRVLATIAILAAVAGVFMWAGMRPFGCDCVQIPFGSHQPGYTRVHAPLAVALHRLPARVVPPAAAGVPAGVYRNHVAVLLLYGRRSPLGVFKTRCCPFSTMGTSIVRSWSWWSSLRRVSIQRPLSPAV